MLIGLEPMSASDFTVDTTEELATPFKLSHRLLPEKLSVKLVAGRGCLH